MPLLPPLPPAPLPPVAPALLPPVPLLPAAPADGLCALLLLQASTLANRHAQMNARSPTMARP
jgi:hypothetical protein